jgi:flagellar motor switch protein FliG
VNDVCRTFREPRDGRIGGLLPDRRPSARNASSWRSELVDNGPRVPLRARMLRAMAITALRKAAVFLGSLPEQEAAGLLATLAPEQAAAVSAEMAAMGPIDQKEQETVVGELAGPLPSDANSHVAHTSEAKDAPVAEVPPFAFLHGITVDKLFEAVGDERPQTVALVLSYLPAAQAAGLVAALPPRQQAAVVTRLARLERPSGEVVAQVAEAIQHRLAGPVRTPIGRGMARLVKMFGAMRPATERKLLRGIAEADPELLRAIRRAMFGPDVAACGEWNLTSAAS